MRCLVFLAGLVMALGAMAFELPPLGAVPHPGKEWELSELDSSTQTNDWRWLVFTNVQTGDLLSYAAVRRTAEDTPGLIHCADSAVIIFPGGRYYLRYTNEIAKSFVKSEVRSDGGREVLELMYVQEDKGGNWMAHNHVQIFEGYTVYVQHTSRKPIASEVASKVAWELYTVHRENSNLVATIERSRGTPPGEPFIYIRGAVNNPNRYAWKEGMKLADAIKVAGGFGGYAHRKKISVHRTEAGLAQFELRGKREPTNNPVLMKGDIVFVPKREW